MLFLEPFTRAKDLQPGAVDQNVCWPSGQRAPFGNRLQAYGAPTHGAVVRGLQVQPSNSKFAAWLNVPKPRKSDTL
jgi:hypothetical protein